MKKTPSLDTCKKLKEAGFDVETERVWTHMHFDPVKGIGWELIYSKDISGADHTFILAPDMAEIWEALPEEMGVVLLRDDDSPIVCKDCPNRFQDDNPVEVLAHLWLRIKENHPEALAPAKDLDPRPEDIF